MERHTTSRLGAIALAAYGVCQALHAVATLGAPESPLMLLAFAPQAVLSTRSPLRAAAST